MAAIPVARAQGPPGKQWDATFGGADEDHLLAAHPTADGGYIVGGVTASDRSGDKSQSRQGARDYWVVKFDAQGAKQWDKTIGGDSYDDFRDLIPTSDGGYLLGGASFSGATGDKTQPSRGSTDYWVVKLDAQGAKQWDRTIGGPGADDLYSVRQTADGGYLLGGSSYSGAGADKSEPSRGGVDFWLVKLNAQGSKQWDKTYGGNGGDYFGLKALTLTRDGGCLIGGFSDSGVTGDKTQPCWGGQDGDFWVVKLDAQGVKQWDRTVGGTLSERLATVCQTADGGYLLSGSSASGVSGTKTEPNRGPLNPTGFTGFDYWVVKLNPAGVPQWDRTVGTLDNEYLADAAQTADGGYVLGGDATAIVGGDKTALGKGLVDEWVIKLGPDGSQQWDLVLGGSGVEGVAALQPTTDG